MNKRKLWTLIAVPCVAGTSLLLAFLSLSGNMVSATLNKEICSEVWVVETVDSAGNVGGNTSLVLEPVYPYTPHISHHAAPSGSASGDMFVKHAWFNGATWLSETVDLGCGSTSLALVPAYPNALSIGYDSSSASCEAGTKQVKFAWLEGTTWISRVVYNPPDWNPDAQGASLALESTSPYTPHIANYAAWNVSTLYHAYLSGTIWISSTWVLDPVETHGVGHSNSLALESTNPHTPHIIYTGTSDELKHAWLSGTTWLSETVDNAENVEGFSLALDHSGNPHISYVDETNDTLRYAWLSGTTWFSETVDSVGGYVYNRRRSSLKLDQSDLPYISYYDTAKGDLKLAYLSGTGWNTRTVDSEGNVGAWSSLALDQAGCPHISYHDETNGDLKYAYLSPVQELTGVTITGPTLGAIHISHTFTATASPITSTKPITYVWQTTEWNPLTATHSTDLTNTVSFFWGTTGTKTITVKAQNVGGTVSDTHVVTIVRRVYLPIITKCCTP